MKLKLTIRYNYMMMHSSCCILFFVLLEFAQSSKRFKSLLKMLLENEKEKSPLSPSLGFWPERPSSLTSLPRGMLPSSLGHVGLAHLQAQQRTDAAFSSLSYR